MNTRLQIEFIQSHNTVTEDKYWEMLGCVPPIRQASNAFLVGEPVDHIKMVYDKTGELQKTFGKIVRARYELYFIDSENKYNYGGLVTTHEFDLFTIIKCYDCGTELSLNSSIATSDNRHVCEACDTKRNIKAQ